MTSFQAAFPQVYLQHYSMKLFLARPTSRQLEYKGDPYETEL